MKKLFLLSSFLFFVWSMATAQRPKWPDLDKSPMDAIYYPGNAAWRNYLTGDDRNASLKLKIVYSRPQKNGREIFGNLVPYGKEWRLGANQATEITCYQGITFGDAYVPYGAYTMFATPSKDGWEITLSSQRNIWGGANRDLSKNIATIQVPTEMMKGDALDALSMAFQRVDDDNLNLVIGWDKTQVTVPINLNPVQFSSLDVSPMEEAIFPGSANGQNYLKAEEIEANQPKVRVRYCRPQKKGRAIFGDLVPYGEVWRVGANESTVVTFYKDAMINGTKIKAGAYNMYATVNEKSWDIIFNTDMPAWGAHNRDESKDIATVTLPVTKGKEAIEAMAIIFEEKSDNEIHMVIGWDKTRVAIPIKM